MSADRIIRQTAVLISHGDDETYGPHGDHMRTEDHPTCPYCQRTQTRMRRGAGGLELTKVETAR